MNRPSSDPPATGPAGGAAFAPEVLRAFFERSPFSTVVYDARGYVLAVNEAFRALWGAGAESVPEGYNVLDDPQLEAQGVGPLLRRAFAGETVVTPPVRYDVGDVSLTGEGRAVWTQGHLSPVRDAGGRVTHVVLSHIDLTDRVAVEEALRASERRFGAIVEQATAGIAQVDLTGRFVLVNDRFCELVGRPREVLLGLTMQAITHADDLPPNLTLLRRCVTHGEPFVIEKRYVRPDGADVWVSNSVTLLRDDRGEPAAILAVVFDVGDRRRAERAFRLLADAGEALGTSLDYAQTLRHLAALPVPALARWSMLFVAEEGALRCVATACHDPDKADAVAALGRRVAALPPDEPTLARSAIETRAGRLVEHLDAMADGLSRDAEYRALLRALAPVSLMAVPLLAGEHVLGAMVLATDEATHHFGDDDLALAGELGRRAAAAVERARLYEHALADRAEAERTRQRTQELIAGIGDALVAYDHDWRIVFINQGGREVLARAGVRGDPAGQVLWELLPTLHGTELEQRMREAMRRREPTSFDMPAHGTPGWVGVRLYPTADGLLAFWTDVSEAQRAREASALLADASAALATALDVETAVQTFARIVVDRLADFCGISLLEPDGRLATVEVAHRDPARVALAWELERGYPPPPDAEHGAPAVARSGRSLLHPVIRPEELAASARDAEHLRLLQRLELHSVMIVPLTARGRTLGTIACVSAESRRVFDAHDLALAEELARRAAVAVDNARLLREAETARHEAEQANRAKTEFLTTMSHELRTPLNAIAGYTELLEMGIHGPVTAAQQEALGRIARSQRHLLTLVNEVLHFARIDAGHLQLAAAAIPVEAVFAALQPLVEPQAQMREIHLEWQPCPPDAVVLADEDRLRQVLLNLVTNAVKFTPPGGRVRVGCALYAGRVELSVADTGPGIPPEDAARVFDPFVQLERRLSNPVEGTGLGLAISRTLAEAMGGGIALQSTPGEGATFTLTLPRAGEGEG